MTWVYRRLYTHARETLSFNYKRGILDPMFNRIRKIPQFQAISHISTYFAGSIFKAVLPFLILPILTIYLSPSEYGTWNVNLAILSLAIPLTAMGMPMVLGRNYHQYDRERHAGMMGSGLILIAIVNLVFTAIIFLYGQFIGNEFMGIPVYFFYILPALCFLKNLQVIHRAILKHQHRVNLFTVIDITNSVFIRLSGLFIVMFFISTWQGLFYAQVITVIIFSVNAIYHLAKDNQVRFTPDLQELKSLAIMGWPLIFHAVGGIIMNFSDRLILQEMTGAEDVGLYSLGANIGIAVLMFCHAFNGKWSPWFYKKLKNPTEADKRKIVKYTYLYFLVTILLTFCVAIAGYIYINYFIDAAYAEAAPVMIWITIGAGLYGLSFAVTHYIIHLGHMRTLPIITASCAVINIVLTILMVDVYGMIGAAYATVIAYAIFFIVMWWVNNKRYPMPWFARMRG
jgi:O-antigen/teichoic acid export membrane protein